MPIRGCSTALTARWIVHRRAPPHHQDDLITKCLAIPYKKDATCPTWKAFLWRIMGGSQGEDTPEIGVGELEQRQQADARAEALIVSNWEGQNPRL